MLFRSLLVDKVRDLGRLTLPSVTTAIEDISKTLRDNGLDWGKWADQIKSHIVEGGFIDRLMKFVKEPFTLSSLRELFPQQPPSSFTEIPQLRPLPGPRSPPRGEYTPIPTKPGAGASSPVTRAVEAAIADVPGIKEVTSRDDAYHRFLGRRSLHTEGRAVDVSVTDPSKIQAV